MKKDLDFYEFAAIIIPGMVMLLFVAYLHPHLRALILNEKIGIGEFGMLLLLSYVCGHLMQAFSSLWEPAFWGMQHGMPTNWVLREKQKLLSPSQVDALAWNIAAKLKVMVPGELQYLPYYEWLALVAQMNAAVHAAGKADRLDKFLGNCGLLRGTVSVLLLMIGFTIAIPIQPFSRILGCLIALTALSLYQTRRFGIFYARELFVQFLQLPAAPAVVTDA